jgi:hypothetical protein
MQNSKKKLANSELRLSKSTTSLTTKKESVKKHRFAVKSKPTNTSINRLSKAKLSKQKVKNKKKLLQETSQIWIVPERKKEPNVI